MPVARVLKFFLVAAALFLAGCAAEPQARLAGKLAGRVWDPKLGVWSSPQMVADGEAVPRGGGSYLTGRPYVIGGHTYVPSANPNGYAVVGTASWYGDAFHGRRTANGEVFDKRSISAAHPTLPLPSYVRVTNMGNGRSMIVRVNDRGPYHGGRVMDVSQRVAEALSFRGAGTARIRVDYIGKAPLSGSDDETLMASLRTDGGAAQMPGMSSAPTTLVADASDERRAPTPAAPSPNPVATRPPEAEQPGDAEAPVPSTLLRRAAVPVPPARPFSVGPMPDLDAGSRHGRRRPVPSPATAMLLPPVAPHPSPLLRHAASSPLRRQASLAPRRDTDD
ncbi:septal ring lytic transglycosylase RlpA family protein [Lichenihabitans sp. Uapishka_5]|uniref:septal ring lytic transglycosylase RlpA family protein n=1 Tax=Lichenihabitans sp. Uapishka_5 TaxID=3037302 RepID=UPI0029E7F258|nr:septal ring lytic transglycosylase RlpA family protein [Lichenihabitans sp. Uapishka_5]